MSLPDYDDMLRNALARSLKKTKGDRPYRINGFGTTMLGSYAPNAVKPAFFTVLWLTALFIPIVPLRIYLVDHPKDKNGRNICNSYRFYGKIGFKDFRELFPEQLSKLLSGGVVQGAMFLFCVISALIIWVLASGWLHGLFRSR